MKKIKVLAIQFKYLGDAVILTPALKALKTQIPNVELHVLVASEIAPLLENIPWIDKVWAMPRKRGKAKLIQALPFVKALRTEKFDQSIDFGGNDRGAILSYLSGSKIRLGPIDYNEPKLIQKICYTQIVRRKNSGAPYFDLHFELLSLWNIKRPKSLQLEAACNSREAKFALNLLPKDSIICHISTSQPKKDWPVTHWGRLQELANQAGLILYFSAGNNDREKKLLNELRTLKPEIKTLPPLNSLNMFLCALKSSRMLICGDTGPLHFAEGLGVPVLGIFAVGNSIRQVAPIYHQEQLVCANKCACDAMINKVDYCQSAEPCMASILPEAVFTKLKSILAKSNLN